MTLSSCSTAARYSFVAAGAAGDAAAAGAAGIAEAASRDTTCPRRITRIELQWHGVKQRPGVIRLVRIGNDEPAHVPDKVIDALARASVTAQSTCPSRGRRYRRLSV
jgi:hypothetical protein